jgi:hypothetical protein
LWPTNFCKPFVNSSLKRRKANYNALEANKQIRVLRGAEGKVIVE